LLSKEIEKMNKLYPIIKLLMLVCFTFLTTSAVQGQNRTWVSGVGDDMNPCSRTAPCKTFAGAISKTLKDGEISVLDPGGYGSVTITKSIYINGTHGAGYGSITSPLVNGIIINITDATDVRKAVRLRALDINGVSTGINGVSILAANNVHIEDCVIDGFTGNGTTTGIGIRVAATNNMNLYVTGTEVHKTITGLRVTTSTGFAVANIVDSRFNNNTTGLEASTNGVVTIKDSVVARNSGDGLRASSATNSFVIAQECMIASNVGVGLNASVAGSSIRALSNYIIGNGTGINAVGTVETDGQNRNTLNSVPGAPNGGLVTIQ
jgi:hypothetical protein